MTIALDATSTTSTSTAAPRAALPYPPLHKDAKFVVLSDWDGTITQFDSNDYLIDNYGMGREARREYNVRCLKGETNFRDMFRAELESIPFTFDKCTEILVRENRLDTGFAEFFQWCKANGVPFVIVSSGMEPLIRAVLTKLVGEEDAKLIDIIANDVKVETDGTWNIQYRHPDSGFGHDKSQAILPYRALPEPPTLFFFGDGVSDMSAAAHADVLFAKTKEDGESDLAHYCEKLGIKHVLFNNFGEALPIVQSVVRGEVTPAQALEKHGR